MDVSCRQLNIPACGNRAPQLKCALWNVSSTHWPTSPSLDLVLSNPHSVRILVITLCLWVAAAVMPGTKLQEHSGSDKAWVWSTMDFATEQQKMELFCLKLPASKCLSWHDISHTDTPY